MYAKSIDMRGTVWVCSYNPKKKGDTPVRGLFLALFASVSIAAGAGSDHQTDLIPTPSGPVAITFLGHGTLMIVHRGTTLHIDPWGKVADYGTLPKGDIVLVTHHHGDHLDPAAITLIAKGSTRILASAKAAESLQGATPMKNGDTLRIGETTVTAVPAYNLVNKRENGQPFHPRGEGNGYVITIAGLKIYVAGDTENTPEMKKLTGIDVAFLPMNLPYTMTPAMVADAAQAFRPRILYPYHFGETDTALLLELMKGVKGVEIRMRAMK